MPYSCASIAALALLTAQGESGAVSVLPNLATELSGKADILARSGSAALGEDGLYGDLALAFEAESITQAGLRWGASVSLRVQRDSGRRGLARQVGNCPPGFEDCPSTDGRAPAGLFTGFHSVARLDPAGIVAELEEANLFLKTGLWEARIGRGPGAARLEAEALPGAFRLARADTAPIDPEGLALVQTANTLSTNSAKLTVRSRRLVGFRVSASYTPQAESCGVDVCRLASRPGGPVSAEIDNVFEAGLSFDRRFRGSGRHWTLAVTAGRGEASGPLANAFEDPWAVSARAVVRQGDLSAGFAVLQSNDGVAEGDYRAIAASAAIEHGAWLTALEFGHGESELVHAEGWTLQLGSSRLFENGALAGFGLRHGETSRPVSGPGGRLVDVRATTSFFVEAGLRF